MNVALFLILTICAGALIGASGYASETRRPGWSIIAFILGFLFAGVAVWALVRAGR